MKTMTEKTWRIRERELMRRAHLTVFWIDCINAAQEKGMTEDSFLQAIAEYEKKMGYSIDYPKCIEPREFLIWNRGKQYRAYSRKPKGIKVSELTLRTIQEANLGLKWVENAFFED